MEGEGVSLSDLLQEVNSLQQNLERLPYDDFPGHHYPGIENQARSSLYADDNETSRNAASADLHRFENSIEEGHEGRSAISFLPSFENCQ